MAISQGVSRRGVACIRRRISGLDASGLVVWRRMVRFHPDLIGPFEFGNVSFEKCLLDFVEEVGVVEQVSWSPPLRRGVCHVEEFHTRPVTAVESDEDSFIPIDVVVSRLTAVRWAEVSSVFVPQNDGRGVATRDGGSPGATCFFENQRAPPPYLNVSL